MSTYDKYKEVLLRHMEDIDSFMPYIATFQSRLLFTKMIQQYEIFKLALGRPGHVVELGVYHGESFFHWARLVEAFNIGERETRVIGFDSFTGFPSVHGKDVTTGNQRESGPLAIRPGGFNAGEQAYRRIMELVDVFEADHFVPGKKRLEIVRGDIATTVPEYVRANPGLRISLLHLDCDLYEPTLVALKHLYPLVVAGGVVILDEYGQSKFAGESAAFDEYFGDRRPVLQKSHLISNPSGWFVKEG